MSRLNRISYIGSIRIINGCDYVDPNTNERCTKIDSRPYDYGMYCILHRCALEGCTEVIQKDSADYCKIHARIVKESYKNRERVVQES